MPDDIYTVAILHDLRSAHNVGSVLRTADAAGVCKLYLTGTTPAPTDRYGRSNRTIAKVSLGAEKSVRWEYIQSVTRLITKLRKDNYKIVAVEQHEKARDYRKYKLKGRTAVIFGNEVSGIQQKILDRCDEVLEIPQYGAKESLNVAVAAGVILFHFH
jgi:23S rRNA (guanosine2251-2'-O)-methyltransferase